MSPETTGGRLGVFYGPPKRVLFADQEVSFLTSGLADDILFLTRWRLADDSQPTVRTRLAVAVYCDVVRSDLEWRVPDWAELTAAVVLSPEDVAPLLASDQPRVRAFTVAVLLPLVR
jgi:hypothetical protein